MCMYILVHVRLCVFSQKLARWADLSGDRVVSGDGGAGKKVVYVRSTGIYIHYVHANIILVGG